MVVWRTMCAGRRRLMHRVPVVVSVDGGAGGLAGLVNAGGGFDMLKVVPAHLPLLGELIDDGSASSAARVLVVGGEALTGSAVRSWLERVPGSVVVNEYGPTETVVGCCVFRAEAGSPVGSWRAAMWAVRA